MCHTCHTWAHAHPHEAQQLGLIVSTTIEVPGDVPVTTFHGIKILTCDGFYRTPLPIPPITGEPA